MPQKQNNNKQNNRKRQPSRNTPKKKRRKNAPKSKKMPPAIASVINPCAGPIVPGIYGSIEGLTARVKNSHATVGSGTDTCGAILWVPSYTSGGSTAWNLIRFSYSDPAANFLNSGTSPMGVGSIFGKQGIGLEDPATPFVNTDLVRDVRTLAACLQLTYTGIVTESAGQIAWVNNYNLQDLLATPNINNLFDSSTKTARLGLDTYEVLFRPDVDSGCARFRSRGISTRDPAVTATAGSGIEAALGPGPELTAPKVIGFAYRNCHPGVLDKLIISCTKVVEWRPESASGITTIPQTDLRIPSTSNLMASLDETYPQWASRIASGTVSAAGRASTSVWEGLQTKEGQALARIGVNYFGNQRRLQY